MERIFKTSMRYVEHNVKPGHLKFMETTIPVVADTTKEALIKIKGTALNRADILQMKGMYNPPKGESTILGLEAAGVEVDPHSLEEIGGGQIKGVLLPGGGFAEYVRVDRRHLINFPSSITIKEACSIPEAWLTSFLLTQLSNICEGEYAYVNAGASGIGTSLTQLLSVYSKANPIVTCSTEEKIKFSQSCGAKDGIALNDKDITTVGKELLQLTEGKGFSSAFDSVGPSQTLMISDILNTDSTWVLYGLLSGINLKGESDLLMKMLVKRITMRGTTLRHRSKDYKAELVSKFNTDIIPLFSERKLFPVIDTSIEVNLNKDDDVIRIEELFSKMKSNSNKGKLVIIYK